MEFFIPIAALFSAIGNFFMKLSANKYSYLSQIYFIGGGISYMLNLFFFKKGLSLKPLSLGYPLLATISIIFSTLLAILFLNESLKIVNIFGIIFCCLGIIFISK